MTGRRNAASCPGARGSGSTPRTRSPLQAPALARPRPLAATRWTSPSCACAGSRTSPTSTRWPPSPASRCATRALPQTSSAPTSSSSPARRRPSPIWSRCVTTGSIWRWPAAPHPAGPILGICGGYQLLGERIEDTVESHAGVVMALGCCRSRRCSPPTQLLRRRAGQRHRGSAASSRRATRSAMATRARAAAASRF